MGVIAKCVIRTKDNNLDGYHDIFVNTNACWDYIHKGSIYEVEDITSRTRLEGMIKANQSIAC